MLTTLTVTRKLKVSPPVAWDALVAVGKLDVWFPSIKTCVVEGAGVGAKRQMILDGGFGDMTDEIMAIDETARRITYHRIASPFPVDSYVGNVEVFESFDGRAVLSWTVNFESAEDMADFVYAILNEAITAGVEGMDNDLAA